MADALEYLHKQGYLHRDICPRNVMVTKEGVVKLIDFGLTIPYTPEFCKPGNRTGTPNYLAPELIRRTTTDHRVDLFALGVTAYEVFTGDVAVGEGAVVADAAQPHEQSRQGSARDLSEDGQADGPVPAQGHRARSRRSFQTAADFRDALQRLPKA